MGVTVLVGVSVGGRFAVQLGDGLAVTGSKAGSDGVETITPDGICEGCAGGFTDPQAETTIARRRMQHRLLRFKLPQLTTAVTQDVARHHQAVDLPGALVYVGDLGISKPLFE